MTQTASTIQVETEGEGGGVKKCDEEGKVPKERERSGDKFAKKT